MAKIKNVSGEDLVVPALRGRLVEAGQVIDVPDDQVYGYTQQELWEVVDKAAQAAHDDGYEAYLGRRAEELGGPVDDQGNPLPPAELVEPAGNAAREEWADYVVRAGLAAPEDLEGKGRDQIRDTYSGDQAAGDTTDTSDSDGSS